MSDVISKLQRLRTYVEGVDASPAMPANQDALDEILSYILGGLDETLDALTAFCLCSRTEREYCQAEHCQGGTDLPLDWTDTTWSKVAEGDEVLGAEDKIWVCTSTKLVPDGRLSASIERGTDRFHFYPAPGQHVLARRGPTGTALEVMAAAGFTVDVITNGRAA